MAHVAARGVKVALLALAAQVERLHRHARVVEGLLGAVVVRLGVGVEVLVLVGGVAAAADAAAVALAAAVGGGDVAIVVRERWSGAAGGGARERGWLVKDNRVGECSMMSL